MSDFSPSRRTFLQASALGLAAVTASRAAGSNERLSVGMVGPGGRGRGLLRTFLRGCKADNAELTAVCDIWSRSRELGVNMVKEATGKEPRTFTRLEDMLEAKDLDAVIIAT